MARQRANGGLRSGQPRCHFALVQRLHDVGKPDLFTIDRPRDGITTRIIESGADYGERDIHWL